MKSLKELLGFDRLLVPSAATTATVLKVGANALPQIESDVLIGLEVEVENVPAGFDEPAMAIWIPKEDGSLRNHGVEYVTRGAVPAHLVPAALTGLYKAMFKYNPAYQFSHRCGFHYHVDMRDMTPEQLVVFMLLYHITEPLLFRFCNPARAASNFCVPSEDTSGFYNAVHWLKQQCIDEEITPQDIVQFTQLFGGKYAALGVFRMIDLGTVEFRHMEGTDDLTRLVRWISFGVSLREAATRMSFGDLRKKLSTLNTVSTYYTFLHDIFGGNVHLIYRGEDDIPVMSNAVANTKHLLITNWAPPNFKTLLDSPLGEYLITAIDKPQPAKKRAAARNEDILNAIRRGEPVFRRAGMAVNIRNDDFPPDYEEDEDDDDNDNEQEENR